MIFADVASLNSVPADFLKYYIVTTLALIIAACIITNTFNKRRTVRGNVRIEPQPVEVRKAPQRYNHALTEQKFSRIDERLDDHDAAALEKINARFERVLLGLTAIGVKVGATIPKDE